ncbi:MAG: hypothetical protein ABI333_30450 [bacterium]
MSDPRETAPRPLFTRDDAEQIVPRRQFGPVRAFFERAEEAFTAEVERVFWGYAHVELRENLDNFGLYLLRMDFPVPFLWFGLGWAADDAPGTLPSWGASLEVNGDWVKPFKRDVGGLRPSWEAAAKMSQGRVGLYLFDKHVELAEWRPFDWLLESPDQPAAILEFWRGYLRHLAEHGVAEAIDAFIERAE